MPSKKHIRSRLAPGQHVMLVFLLLCFIGTSLSQAPIYREFGGDVIKKSAHSWSKRDAQIPLEEKEKEVESSTDEKTSSEAFFSALIRECAQIPFFYLSVHHSVFSNAEGACDPSVPIYLTKRTFLI